VIEIEGLTVHFGGVTSIDRMSVSFGEGSNGLIGPNGAGKTTFFNVLSGFVTPAAGRILAFGDDLSQIPSFRRARWGIRRTFQTEQAIETLTVFDNVLTVYENTTAGGRKGARQAVMEALELVGLTHVAHSRVRSLGARGRRFVEVARAVVGTPRLVLLDEPGAGLPEEETELLAQAIRQIPDRVGATVILVEHDMSLVQSCCTNTAVLDFGRLIASGPTGEVLRNKAVMEAYLGVGDVP
jgi:ABC-type branched-subunit amino acid transport system ATPase component